MMKKLKNTALIFYMVSVVFYIAAIIGFTGGNSSAAIVWLCLGSTFLCLGSSAAGKSGETAEKQDDGKNEDKEEK